MRSIQIFSCVAVAVVLTLAGASWGDGDGAGEEPDEDIDDMTEPITGEAVNPNPGDEQPMRDPFTPYDIGGTAAAWRLEDLTAEEQAVALRGLDDDQSGVQDAYAEAARGMAERARAEHPAIELRMQQLEQIGVVP